MHSNLSEEDAGKFKYATGIPSINTRKSPFWQSR